jgi:hypothetical protein
MLHQVGAATEEGAASLAGQTDSTLEAEAGLRRTMRDRGLSTPPHPTDGLEPRYVFGRHNPSDGFLFRGGPRCRAVDQGYFSPRIICWATFVYFFRTVTSRSEIASPSRMDGWFQRRRRSPLEISRKESVRPTGLPFFRGVEHKIEHLTGAGNVYAAFFNFCRAHQVPHVAPAMRCGVASDVWTIEELIIGKDV